jgi:hypothetical protein
MQPQTVNQRLKALRVALLLTDTQPGRGWLAEKEVRSLGALSRFFIFEL